MGNENVDYNIIRIDVKLQMYSVQVWKLICEDGISYIRRDYVGFVFFYLVNSF